MRLKMAITMLAGVAFAATAGLVSADDEKTSPGHQKARGKGHAKHADGDDAASRDSTFRAWDRDGNGSISRGEYPGHPGNFRALDTDNDGGLSFEEFQHRASVVAPPSGAATTDEFAAKDHDGSGTLSRAEWPDAFEFDRRDHNRDGLLSRDEYASPRAPAARDDEFRRLDTDNDGVLARGEWRGRPSVFDALDSNRNGVLSRDEYIRGSARGRLVK